MGADGLDGVSFFVRCATSSDSPFVEYCEPEYGRKIWETEPRILCTK